MSLAGSAADGVSGVVAAPAGVAGGVMRLGLRLEQRSDVRRLVDF